MWFRRKKPVEPVRQKRKPKEWSIPKENAIELIGLFDDMMAASVHIKGIGDFKTRHLPRYLFWQRMFEVLPEIRGLSVVVEPVKDHRCIKIVETVADDDFEPEPEPSPPPTAIESSTPDKSLSQMLDDIEAKPDTGDSKDGRNS